MTLRGKTGCALALCFCLLSGIVLRAHAQSFTTLHSFAGPPSEGAATYAGLIQASDGNLYGVTLSGGANNNGTIFKLTTGGTLTVLYSFSALSNGVNTDGAQPVASLIQASDGNLYGTTTVGGAYKGGTIFKITTGGTLTVLHSFNGNTDGNTPHGRFLQATDGNLYGTCWGSGANGKGTVYKITTGGTFTLLHTFQGTDGANPDSYLIQASDGNLYSTTPIGAANNTGTVFKITTGGALTTLYSFSPSSSTSTPPYANSDGASPDSGLIQASDGNLYSTCQSGGANGTGTVFKITTGGSLTVLHTFSALTNNRFNNDGAYPDAGLIQASDGNLYSTCPAGGANGDGTLFQISLSGTFNVLHAFNGTDGNIINSRDLLQASDGNLYGTTYSGGANNDGTIFAYDLGTSTAPTLSSLNPGSVNAGGPAFTLNVKGTDFSSTDSVHWIQGTSTNALSTTYVSATQLKASVPASLIASPGKATITVVTSGGLASNSKSVTIKQTTLKLTSATLTKSNTGAYTASISLKNIGYLSASNVNLTSASLGPASTSTALPVSLGSLAAGATTSTSLSFPGSTGSSGTVVTLKVSGKFTGGTFSGSLKVTLP